MNNDYQDFKDYLHIQNVKVRNNIEEVKASDLPFPYMLHIDLKLPSKFIPMMPRRAAPSEDNTIPRITVADTLIGCIIGYASLFFDFFATTNQGYYISAIDFDYCIKPNVKLVYDADATNEHWLLGYNRKHLSYKPYQIGKFFVDEILSRKEIVNGEAIPIPKSMTLYMELEKAILFNIETVLEKGYYKIVTTNNLVSHTTFKDATGYDIQKISAGEYFKNKKVATAMLSLKEEQLPLSGKW